MISRRESFKLFAATTAALAIPRTAYSGSSEKSSIFRFCLNTSTIMGQNLSLPEKIEIAAKAGYEGVELWVRDIKDYLEGADSLKSLRKFIKDSKLTVENAIGFAEWIVDDEERRKAGFSLMKEEMEIMADLGCTRIAAPPAGAVQTKVDLFLAGERYKKLLELGRQTGVMPQLEFWGASTSLFHIGQALMIASIADDPDVRLLPDVYHMFRGGSGFNSLKIIKGNIIEVFHINDYPGRIPRKEQTDSHRVYPGDGIAPFKEIMSSLKNMGGAKVLSLELFNREYWNQDALQVAKTGLQKMKDILSEV